MSVYDDLTPDQRRQVDELFGEFIDAGLIEVYGVSEDGQIMYRAVG